LRHPVRLAALVALAVLLVGCAGGKAFVRPSSDELVLGTTTEQEIRTRLGDPRRQGTALRNGQTVTTLSYAYALAVPYVDDVKTRAMGFYFLNGTLVGYEFTSSFDEDKTRFDDSKIRQIQRGQTTRQDVIALFGRPGGMYAYPLLKDKDAIALVYFFIDSERHPFGATVKQTRKLLVVPIDRQGVVSDIEYTASEPK
jgi:hypothetical protein